MSKNKNIQFGYLKNSKTLQWKKYLHLDSSPTRPEKKHKNNSPSLPSQDGKNMIKPMGKTHLPYKSYQILYLPKIL